MAGYSLLLVGLLLLAGGCAKPPSLQLQAARTAIEEARAAEAPVLAPTEYRSAQEALRSAEELIQQKKYRMAEEVLPFAEDYARRAMRIAEQEQANRELQTIRAQEILRSQQLPEEKPIRPTPQTKRAITARPVPPPQPLKPPPPPLYYRVREGETLWTIAARREIYGDALLWPLLYQANRDQIRDPRQIHGGQTLNIPRELKESEKRAAREKARRSKIFPAAAE